MDKCRNEKIHSEIVYISGKTVHKCGNTDETVPVNSITKTVTALLTGIALKRGLIESTDDRACDYIRGYDIDERITVERLLTMSPGIDWDEKILNDREDWIKTISEREVIEENIGKFQYGSASSHLLGRIIQETSGMLLEDFAIKYLFSPLGIEYSKEAEYIEYYIDEKPFKSFRRWDITPEGQNAGSFALRLSAEDLLKIGKIFLGPSEFITEEFRKNAMSPKVKAEGYGYYGYQGWIKKIKGYNVYSAIGVDDKYLSIVPELELVFVMLSEVKKEQKRAPLTKTYISELIKYIKLA